jgi:hypothetical protein
MKIEKKPNMINKSDEPYLSFDIPIEAVLTSRSSNRNGRSLGEAGLLLAFLWFSMLLSLG